MTEHALFELVQNLARQRGRSDQNPLVLLRTLAASEGSRVSHLPISQRLSHAWVTLTGEPFRLHQSLALSSLRRGEPFALIGGGAAARQTLYLLMHEVLRGEMGTSALLLLPDAATVALYRQELVRLSDALDIPLAVATIEREAGSLVRKAITADVLLVTPRTLHERLLRHHDRAWQMFWSRLRMLVLGDIDCYNGVAVEHLAGLLMRSLRLAPLETGVFLAATASEVVDADTVLESISGQPWRIISVEDVPHPATVLALWQADNGRLGEAASLALACRREGYQVHITCEQLELPLLHQMLDPHNDGISVGPVPQTAQVQIIAGYSGARSLLRQALSGTTGLVIQLLGTLPIERTLVRLTSGEGDAALLQDDGLPAWVLPAANAYITVQHLLCAATERPMTFDEVVAWQSGEIIDRMERQAQLVRLPGNEAVWQPAADAGDPYADFGLRAAGIPTAYLADERGNILGAFDPSAFDRWGFVGASLPPGRCSYRVVDRNEEAGTLILASEQQNRRTFPLRRCTVEVRDERDQYVLRGRTVTWGRVVINEEIAGYREARATSTPSEHVLTETLPTRWAAPAVWIDLPLALQSEGQLVGWSLTAALPLRVICEQTDIVPAYDHDRRRIYFVDAQPGGNGLAVWIYEHFELLLQLAYDVALDCRNDPLLEPVARADMDWLLAVLGGVAVPGSAAPVRAAPSPVTESVATDQTMAAPSRRASTTPPPPQATGEPSRTSEAPPVPPAPEPKPAQAQAALPLADAPEPSAPQASEPPPIAAEPVRQRPERRNPQGRTPARRSRRNTPAPHRPDESQRKSPKRSDPPARHNHQPPPEPVAPTPPDAQAMIARMRRMREQRESEAQAQQPAVPAKKASVAHAVEPIFKAGERVFCQPYGYGVIQSSLIENDEEVLQVEFPDYGNLTIKPSVSVVRRIADEPTEEDDVF